MATKKKQDDLDALVAGDPREVIALMLWKARRANPDLYVQIEQKDIDGFYDCVRYLKVEHQVQISRPEGLPAHPGVPAAPGRRAIPARQATPPKPYVMVTLVDQKGDAIRPVENNEDDFDAAKEVQKLKRARDQAPDLAQRIVAQARSGEYSLSDIQDAAEALITLSRAA